MYMKVALRAIAISRPLPNPEGSRCRGGNEAVAVGRLRRQAVGTGRQGAAAQPSGEAETVGTAPAADREAADLAVYEGSADGEAVDLSAGQRSALPLRHGCVPSAARRPWDGRAREPRARNSELDLRG